MNEDKIIKPKNPVNHLHAINMTVALLASLVSVTTGVLSLKANFFSPPKYGHLSGVVRDTAIAKPLWMSAVEVKDEEGNLIDTAETDKDGAYQIKELKQGNYVVRISAPLHEEQTRRVKIESGKSVDVNFELTPQTAKEFPEIHSEMPSSRQVTVPSNVYPSANSQTMPVTGQDMTSAPAGYQSGSYGGEEPAYVPRRRHRRVPRWDGSGQGGPAAPDGGYAASGSETGNSPATFQDALVQVGGQLVQGWFTNKSDDSTTSSNNS